MGRTAKVEDAVVEQAAVEDAVVKQDAEPQKKGEKLIRFKIPLGSADKDRADVFVAVNGKSYLIKRGVPTELPESVVEVLENAEAQREYAIEFEESARYKD